MNTMYGNAGVNVSLGDLFSQHAARVSRETWHNSRHVVIHDFAQGYFRGPRAFDFVNLPEGWKHDGGMDGNGTKTGPIVEAWRPRVAGFDLMAMTAMDRTRWGYLPLYLDNQLDVSTLGKDNQAPAFKFFCEVMTGLHDAANKIGVVLGYGGELAEMGDFVGSENPDAVAKFNWVGHMLGAMHPNRIIRGDTIAVGDIVIALLENGPRSNGVSALRRALRARFGIRWWEHPDAQDSIRAIATPSVLYDLFLTTLNGWHNPSYEVVLPVKAIAHISGGGIPGKFGEDILYRLGLSAELDDMPVPQKILLDALDWLRSSGEKEATDYAGYDTWHGGPGTLAVVAPEYESAFHGHARTFNIRTQSCGRITATRNDKPRLVIGSQFGSGESLTYPRA